MGPKAEKATSAASKKAGKTANPKIRKERKPKDPNAPKRAQSAYFLWMNGTRNQLKADNPKLTHQELLSKAGKVWKEEMNESEKKPWHEKAAIEKAKYEEALRKYTSAALKSQNKQQQQQQPMDQSEEGESDGSYDDDE